MTLRDFYNRGCRDALKKYANEALVGGLADGKTDADFDPVQLAKGKKVESEHTNRPEIAAEIARDHLQEDPNYYIKLERMEKKSGLPIPVGIPLAAGGLGAALLLGSMLTEKPESSENALSNLVSS